MTALTIIYETVPDVLGFSLCSPVCQEILNTEVNWTSSSVNQVKDETEGGGLTEGVPLVLPDGLGDVVGEVLGYRS